MNMCDCVDVADFEAADKSKFDVKDRLCQDGLKPWLVVADVHACLLGNGVGNCRQGIQYKEARICNSPAQAQLRRWSLGGVASGRDGAG